MGKIIIIHGANYLESKNKFFQFLIRKFYAFFNVKPSHATKRKWLGKLNMKSEEVYYLPWSGNIFSKDLGVAVDDFF